MNLKAIMASSAMILSLATAAVADPFADVPANHWAYNAVNSMAEKGIISGYPDNTFKGEKVVTRFQLAMITAQALANITERKKGLSEEDLVDVEKLTVEFADELSFLGVKTTSLEENMQTLKDDLSGLKNDVDSIKSNYSTGKEKIKLSGDVYIKNYGVEQKDFRTFHRTGTKFRLQLDAQIDENVKAVARWRITDNIRTDNGAVGIPGAAWNGSNHATGDIDTAYLEIKDMFKFHGDFIFGRRFMTHGHALMINDLADAVSYIKRCGDFDLAFNVLFDRQGNEDHHNTWNINADTKYRGHDMYLGLYYTSYRADYLNDIVNVPPAGAPYNQTPFDKNANEYDIEFGSSGDLGNNGYWSYDLGVVYQHIDKAKYDADTGKRSDREGFIAHGAVNWDSKAEWAGKVAFTMVDDGAHMGTKVSYDERFMDSSENPLEDILRDSRYTTNNVFVSNLQDLKVQVEYIPRSNNRHYFRFAYDILQPNNDGKYSTFFFPKSVGGVATGASKKVDIFNAEYRYRLAENTRFRAGYTDFKYDKTAAGEQDYHVYWTELYSHF